MAWKRMVLMCCALTGVGCPSAERTRQNALPKQDVDVGWLTSTSWSQARLCDATRGTWHRALQSCTCPPAFIFSVERGCQDLHHVAQFSDTEILLPNTLRFWFDPGDNPRDLVSSGAFNPAGYSFSEDAEVGWMAVEAHTMDPLRIDALLDELPNGPQALLSTPHPLHRSTVDLSVGARRSRCLALMSGVDDVPPDAPRNLCATAAHLLDGLKRDTLPPLPWVHKRMGLGKKAVAYDVAIFPTDHADVRYRLVGKPGAINNRNLTMAQDGLLAEFALAPDGHVFGGRITATRAEPADANALYRVHTVYFADDFDPVADAVAHRGDRAALESSIAQAARATANGRLLPLPTDSRHPVLRPVRTMILDDAVDLRIPALAQRFGGNAQTFLDGPQNAPWPDLAALDADSLTDHGTQVAGVLVADLPMAQATLVNVHSAQIIQPAKLRQWLMQRIEAAKPQVVNISVSFSDSVGTCAEVFDDIFRRHRRDTLFVVAAGNYGERESPDICPASLAWRYPNVLSVAGTDDRGSLHRSSNWGPKLVNATAPYCLQTVAPTPPDAPETALVQACGTSFSAPWVGNKALKMLAQEPRLTAPEVARRLMEDDAGLWQNYR